MRFTRDDQSTFTVGVRISLVAIALVSIGLGAAYLLGDPVRYSSRGLTVAVTFFHGVRFPGLLFLVCAGWVGIATWAKYTITSALSFCAGYYLFWAVLFLITASTVPNAPPTAMFVYAGMATWCWATNATIKQFRRINAIVVKK